MQGKLTSFKQQNSLQLHLGKVTDAGWYWGIKKSQHARMPIGTLKELKARLLCELLETFVELVDTACSVNEFHLTRKKRVAER